MNYQKRDAEVIWHPYTKHFNKPEFPVVTRAQGSYLYLEDGSKLIDGISSWWVNLHGHSHPHINKRLNEAMEQMQQVMFAGFTHPLAVELAEKILSLFHGSLHKVFFSDNGSTSVEVALKMCLQYWINQGSAKNKIIVFRNSYHGDTFGTMSVSERGLFTKAFWPWLFEVEFVTAPERRSTADPLIELQQLFKRYPNQIAGMIYEPMVQGAGGMLMHDPQKLEAMLSFVQQQGSLLIADEVMTGFGRTGKTFASQHLSVMPDIVCLSKGLTGGVLPLGLTLASDKIFKAFESPELSHSLLHGHSFTGNALSCATALASFELLQSADTQAQIKRICEQQRNFAESLSSMPGPQRQVRSLGTILAMEIETHDQGYASSIRDQLYQHFLKDGILLRPLGNTLYILPPYCISESELNHIYASIKTLLTRLQV